MENGKGEHKGVTYHYYSNIPLSTGCLQFVNTRLQFILYLGILLCHAVEP
jgi:hypothetical protein